MTTLRLPQQRTPSPAPTMMASLKLSLVSSRNAYRMKRSGKRKSRLLRCGKNTTKHIDIIKKRKAYTYNTLQSTSKKSSGEKGRGGGGKLPPRFAKKQSSSQQPASSAQPLSGPTPPAQQQSSVSAPQHPHHPPSQPAANPQTLEGSVASPSTVDFSTKSLPPPSTQTHSTLGTELWENKVAGSAVLPDVKKRK